MKGCIKIGDSEKIFVTQSICSNFVHLVQSLICSYPLVSTPLVKGSDVLTVACLVLPSVSLLLMILHLVTLLLLLIPLTLGV